ncbi:hypothetical protein BpHYR1_000766 [Brachionus plicatilis]|uniref:Uncharacterized protein n=1 Tax=Brachionus plicatilis TaxID=10195 RepID=A0A3M7RTB2_BRAPC|nr:hypothetical protein BpHYR1_000766 [Brachionus plicatilis]
MIWQIAEISWYLGKRFETLDPKQFFINVSYIFLLKKVYKPAFIKEYFYEFCSFIYGLITNHLLNVIENRKVLIENNNNQDMEELSFSSNRTCLYKNYSTKKFNIVQICTKEFQALQKLGNLLHTHFSSLIFTIIDKNFSKCGNVTLGHLKSFCLLEPRVGSTDLKFSNAAFRPCIRLLSRSLAINRLYLFLDSTPVWYALYNEAMYMSSEYLLSKLTKSVCKQTSASVLILLFFLGLFRSLHASNAYHCPFA